MKISVSGNKLDSSFNSSYSNTTFETVNNISQADRIPLSAIPQWTQYAEFNLFTILLAILLNSFLVYLFLRHLPVRTPFNVYTVNLCTVNLAYLLLECPTALGNIWTVFNPSPPALCFFLKYINYVTGGLINNSHLLIAVNRFWAIVAPHSYRTAHRANSLKRPYIVCGTVWIWVQLWVVPGLILDALDPPQGDYERYHCSLLPRGPETWHQIVDLVIYFLPLCVTFLIYPYICYRTLARGRERSRAVGPRTNTGAINRATTRATTSINLTAMNNHSVQDPQANMTPIQRRWRSCMRSHSGGSILTLTLLMMNILFTLFPINVFYFLVTIFHIFLPGLLLVSQVLYALTCIIDPILFLVSVSSFRNAMRVTCNMRQF